MKKIRYGIIGASGHTAQELLSLISQDTRLECVFLQSSSEVGKKSEFLEKEYENVIYEEMVKQKPNVVFFATPHGVCMEHAEKFLNAGIKVIDFSGDFRFKNPEIFEKNYGLPQTASHLNAVFGLPEYFLDDIKNAQLVANPGCYVTSALLGILPIQNFVESVVVDGKSGYSGAGKSFNQHQEIAKNAVMPYKIVAHRHEAEMQQFFCFPLSFTPHLINTYRGMCTTLHLQLKKNAPSEEEIFQIFQEKYKKFPLVKVQKNLAYISEVQKRNSCILSGFAKDENNRLVIISVIDNLRKGASSQALESLYLMFGMDLPGFFLNTGQIET